MPPHVLVADDSRIVRRGLARIIETRLGYRVTMAGNGAEAMELLETRPFDLLITDISMPGVDGLQLLQHLQSIDKDIPTLVVTGHGTLDDAVEAVRCGALDFIQKPIDADRLTSIIRNAAVRRELTTKARLFDESQPQHVFEGMIGASRPMRLIFDQIQRVSRYPAPVLIVGPSGTGKELAARAVHACSPRNKKAFVAFNCAAVAEGLFESLLFGHVRGAFTGATSDQRGLLDAADGGTLFLDEVGEMPAHQQAKLLRVLDTMEVRAVGSSKTHHVDVRLVAATNRDLATAVDAGAFRRDLYYRLRGIALELPPLTDRGDDIRIVSESFLDAWNTRYGTALQGFERTALQVLLRYDWPGNVRELKAVVERAAMLANGPLIHVEDLPEALQRAEPQQVDGEPVLLDEVERQHVSKILNRCDGNKSEAARLLGVSRNALYRLVRRHGLD